MKRDTLPVQHFAAPLHALAIPYLGRVTDVNDPLNLARVKVELYALDTASDVALWARVASPFAGNNRGGFFIPQEDDEVLVVFVHGDARHPVVVGGLWNGAAAPPESLNGKVDRWSITGKAGTRIAIVEQSEATATIACETPGGVKLTMTDEAGGKVRIECAGNTVTIDTQGVSVEAAAKVKVQAAQVEVSAGMVKVDAAMSTFSGVVKCDTLITNAVVSTSYTPGAGNIW
ncbi:phage baseplate assembly protein V [Roseateles sp. DC23W]|uniref:Phage baseplate assembly protein V n=1 Tax=Pelomonas dachongensis TaxID=3299029 RepID=A0ABW7EKA6_9BURK